MIAHLWGSPLNRNFSSLRDVEISIRKITCHPKISNLCNKYIVLAKNVNRKQIKQYQLVITYFAGSIFRYQDVPSCQISVDK